MLRFLSIRNLAVIDRLDLDFEPGLTVLTGETGAGKSILVGAVGLLVGGRASADLVRTGEDQTAVEAVFETPAGDELIVRREIAAHGGRSRAFVNGNLSTTAALKELAAGLVDLHGQHEHQVLLDPSAHLDLLDEFAGVAALRAEAGAAFARWLQIRSERERALAGEREKASRAEFIAFQLGEIDRVKPQPGEDAELSAARQVLANADKLQRLSSEAYSALYEGDHAALPALGTVWKRLAELAAIDERFTPHLDARAAVKSQLDDLAFFLRSYSAGIDASPARLQEVEDRLALLERLKKKHGPTLDDVIAKSERLRRDLRDIEHADQRALELGAALAAAGTEYLKTAGALSKERQGRAHEFSRALETSLADLAMTRTRCQVRFEGGEEPPESAWTERGFDSAEFFISPNPGEDVRPLAKIASGGELSRIMLALKTLATTDAPGKTLIFDEVDAGIGGAAADVVGARLQKLGRRFQVLCITHLPQIAAYGESHVGISKVVKAGRTTTTVVRLGGREREHELARMIGGAGVSSAVLESAREMIATRQAKGEGKAKGERRNTKLGG
jgi:DNA repair protein RecN (Recombination protein N)